MTELTNPTPPTHVLVPIAYWERLCACFYGNGPNYWETRNIAQPGRVSPRSVIDRAIATDEVEEDGPVADPQYVEAVRAGGPFGIPSAPSGVVPYGEAARINGKPTRTVTKAE